MRRRWLFELLHSGSAVSSALHSGGTQLGSPKMHAGVRTVHVPDHLLLIPTCTWIATSVSQENPLFVGQGADAFARRSWAWARTPLACTWIAQRCISKICTPLGPLAGGRGRDHQSDYGHGWPSKAAAWGRFQHANDGLLAALARLLAALAANLKATCLLARIEDLCNETG